MRDITFVITRGAWDGVNAQYKMPWEKFCDWLPKNRCSVAAKTNSMMINTGKFKSISEGAEIAVYSDDVKDKKGNIIFKKGSPRLNSKNNPMPARNKNNMVGYDALMLDYDSGVSLDNILKQFEKYELVYYTTFSHLQKGVEKFRIIIPFTEFCPVAEYTSRKDAFTKFADGATVDTSTFSASRAFYLPSNPVGATEAKDGHQKGEFLDWRSIPKDIKAFQQPKVNYASSAKLVYSKQQMDSVLSQLLYKGQFTYTDAFSIANALYNSGYTYGDFEFFCKQWRPHETQQRLRDQWDSSAGKAPMDFQIFVNILNGKSKIKFRSDPH